MQFKWDMNINNDPESVRITRIWDEFDNGQGPGTTTNSTNRVHEESFYQEEIPERPGRMDAPQGNPAIPPAPGRRIEEIIEVVFPSGAIRRFYKTVETGLEPPLTYFTRRHSGLSQSLDCSCQPQNPYDMSECSNPNCLAITCLAHSDSCPYCGCVYCTRCLTLVSINGIPVVVCKECEKDLCTHWFIKFLKRMIGR